MAIFVQAGYVTTRNGAKIHLDVDGVAHCHSGGKRTISLAQITEASAPHLCRRCVAAFRQRLIWRKDDLYRLRDIPSPAAEREQIFALLDALDEMEPESVKAQLREVDAQVQEVIAKLSQVPEPRMVLAFRSDAEPIDENQYKLF